MDILNQLLSKNATEIIQRILLYLDFKSLHDARTVCKKWNEIVCDLIWDTKKGRGVLKRERTRRWTTTTPELIKYDFFDQMFVFNQNGFAVDERVLVCCLSHVGEGGAKVIDVESRTITAHLDHRIESNNYRKLPVIEVALTKNWIVTYSGNSDISILYVWRRDNFKLDRDIVVCQGGPSWMQLNVHLSATEAKEHLFISCRVGIDDSDPWLGFYNLYRMSQSVRQVRMKTFTNSCHSTILTEELLVVIESNKKTISTFNLEVSELEMFKIHTSKDFEVVERINFDGNDRICYRYPFSISLPYIVFSTKPVVTIWNIFTGELVKNLRFDPVRDGTPGAWDSVVLRKGILVVKMQADEEDDRNVKFYIYDANRKDSEYSSYFPNNQIHRRYEDDTVVRFRINNFSIIESFEDTFVFIDFF